MITQKELYELAHLLGFEVQHECGGYRVVRQHNECEIDGRRDIFPGDGVCRVTSRRNCYIFLLGFQTAIRLIGR